MRPLAASPRPGRHYHPARARHLTRARAVGGAASDAPVIAVVGGGAAGLAAAFFAATAPAAPRVLLLERNPECGKKILISGGTRCNALPAVPVPPDGSGGAFHHTGRQAALRGVLAGWSVEECRAWLLEEAGVVLVEEAETAKLFPASGSAASVRDGLVGAVSRAGVEVVTRARVVGLERAAPSWRLSLEGGAALTADAVILATGGLSYPGLGATGDGLEMVRGLGHSLSLPHPALAPLRGTHPGCGQGGGGGADPAHHLAGTAVRTVALFVQEAAGKKKKERLLPASPRRDLLFTHRGFSGPAILDASHHLSAAFTAGMEPPALIAQWVAGMGPKEWSAVFDASPGGAPISSCLKGKLPARLLMALLAEAGDIPPESRVAELKASEKEALATALGACRLGVSGVDGGWGKAEVTAGGVPLSELDASTLESRLAPGLHVCGELLAPAGRLGGFNFYWAWASGRVAGKAAAEGEVRESREGKGGLVDA